jgi:hypothetical protein
MRVLAPINFPMLPRPSDSSGGGIPLFYLIGRALLLLLFKNPKVLVQFLFELSLIILQAIL